MSSHTSGSTALSFGREELGAGDFATDAMVFYLITHRYRFDSITEPVCNKIGLLDFFGMRNVLNLNMFQGCLSFDASWLLPGTLRVFKTRRWRVLALVSAPPHG
jgi:hypothetical protein